MFITVNGSVHGLHRLWPLFQASKEVMFMDVFFACVFVYLFVYLSSDYLPSNKRICMKPRKNPIHFVDDLIVIGIRIRIRIHYTITAAGGGLQYLTV